jgi:hypothetical protein
MNDLSIRLLERLGSLKTQNVLTDTEFQDLKSWVISVDNNQSSKVDDSLLASSESNPEDEPTSEMVRAKLRDAIASQREVDKKRSEKPKQFGSTWVAYFRPNANPLGCEMSYAQHDSVNELLLQMGVLGRRVENDFGEIPSVAMSVRGIENILDQIIEIDSFDELLKFTHVNSKSWRQFAAIELALRRVLFSRKEFDSKKRKGKYETEPFYFGEVSGDVGEASRQLISWGVIAQGHAPYAFSVLMSASEIEDLMAKCNEGQLQF